MQLIKKLTLVLTAVTVSTNLAIARDAMPTEESFESPKREYSPFVDDHFPIRPLFGEFKEQTSAMQGRTERLLGCRVS